MAIPYQKVQSRQWLSYECTAETARLRGTGLGLRLLQAGGDDEPYTANALAVGLPWRAIAGEGIEGMAIILGLVAIRIRYRRQFPRQLGGTGWGT